MKFLLIMAIAFLAVVAADEEWKPVRDGETIRRVHNECIKETPLTADQNERIHRMEHPDEKEVREYTLCNVKKLGVFTEDKGYNVDRLVLQFNGLFDDAEKLRDIVANCVQNNEQNSTPAELAFRGHQCIQNSKIGEAMKNAMKHAQG